MAKDTLVRDIRLLETELKGKQEAFIRRERVYKTRIDELENTLATLRTSKTEWMQKDPSMAEVRKHHAAILSNSKTRHRMVLLLSIVWLYSWAMHGPCRVTWAQGS